MGNKIDVIARIEELQKENDSLAFLGKMFDKAVKNEFGYSIKELHKIIEKCTVLENKMAAKQGQQVSSPHRGEQPRQGVQPLVSKDAEQTS